MSKNITLNGQTYSGVSEVELPVSGGTAKFKDEDEIVAPTGKKSITDTSEVDVSGFAKAQVVDANLVPENIKKDVSVLGVVGTHQGGGETIYFAGARQYTANVVLPETYTNGSGAFDSSGMTELRSISGPGITSITGNAFIRNPPNVEEVYLPKLSTFNNYIAYNCSYLRTLQLGSVGYPVDIENCSSSNGPLKGSGAADGLTVTTYVDAESLSDAALVTFRAMFEPDARHATFVYRNSVTGEVLS